VRCLIIPAFAMESQMMLRKAVERQSLTGRRELI
jgi:hypothetical protein